MGRSWRSTTMRRPPPPDPGDPPPGAPPSARSKESATTRRPPPTITARSTVTVDADRRSHSGASGSGCASDLWRRRREGSPPGFRSGLG
ncbi:hypothetical protein GN958_ATG23688 [Phytophthora infestans]|uniref:Uncharacterized protein n=1 Tax=Phytophthora infestans TaxID=4787 RepID=A0A8S9TMB4_PHYIN|nr:hypothetical protein GN958_ATG23688 [Phytophthora infestans]